MWLDNDRVGWISSGGVHISTVDGKQQHRFSVRSGWGDCCLIEPVFSPDGTHLVYASREGNNVVDTSGRSTVLPGSAPGTRPSAWSPDSTHIAYATSEGMVVIDTTRAVHRAVRFGAGCGRGVVARQHPHCVCHPRRYSPGGISQGGHPAFSHGLGEELPDVGVVTGQLTDRVLRTICR